jgi:hypothetical protein
MQPETCFYLHNEAEQHTAIDLVLSVADEEKKSS